MNFSTRIRTSVLAFAVIAAAATQAQAESVRCKTDASVNRNYIAPDIRISWDEFGTVRVSDAIIASTGRRSEGGELATNTSRRITVTWEVKDIKRDPLESGTRDAHLVMRLTVERSNGAAVLTIRDVQRRNKTYRTTGVCRFQR
jgi:hypothetical protein